MNIKSIESKLHQIRTKIDKELTMKQKLTKLIFILLLGAVMGFGAKLLDNVSILGEIGTYLGVWVFTATLIGAYSRSPRAGAFHVFAFFISMLSAYYLYSMKIFGFLPKYYLIAWGCFALLSPICAYVIWYSRGKGWIAAFCASLPIGLLIAEGFSFFYTFSIAKGVDLLFASILFSNLSEKKEQRKRALLLSVLVFLVFVKLDILALLFGGL